MHSKPHSYRTIKEEVLRRIHVGKWQPGGLIPREDDLAKEFGCARPTVNRALRELASKGVLDRRRRAGTRVALNPLRRTTMTIPVTRMEIEGKGATYRYVLLELKRTTPPVAIYSKLALKKNSDMLYLRAVHLADGQPYQYETRWINVEAVPEILDVRLDRISANEWLVQNAPFTSGDISFYAATASKEEVEALSVNEGAALFVVEWVTWAYDSSITNVRLAHPPGHRLTSTL